MVEVRMMHSRRLISGSGSTLPEKRESYGAMLTHKLTGEAKKPSQRWNDFRHCSTFDKQNNSFAAIICPMIKKIKAISLKSSNFLIRPTLHWENDWIRILRMSFTKVRMRWSASLATLLLKSSTMKSTQQSISPFSILRSHLRSKGFHVRYTAIYYPF